MSEKAPVGSRRPRVDALIELVLGVLALATFVLVSLGVRGGPEPVLALAFLLVAIRVRRNGEGDPTRRPCLRPGTWLARLRGPDLLLVGTFLVLVGVLHEDGGRLEVDGPLLYMQVRSLVIDRDLDYTNEFAEFMPERFQHWAEEARLLGRPPDPPVEPGPALLWMPFFVLAHGLVLLARLRGSALLADGYGAPYVNAVCLGSLVWAFVGVMLTARLCRRWFSPMLAATCTAGAWLAMPLLWYSVFEPTMPHATATAAVALFLWQWLRVRDQPACRLRWLALAFAGGLLVSMQRYDAYFFLGPALTALALFWNRRRALDRATLRRLLGTAGVLAVVFLVATLPLLVTNLSSRHHSVIAETNLLGFTFRNWAHPYLAEVLFSSRNGLFSWTPVAYLGVVGLALFGRREPRLAAALGLTLAFGLYLFSASWGWGVILDEAHRGVPRLAWGQRPASLLARPGLGTLCPALCERASRQRRGSPIVSSHRRFPCRPACVRARGPPVGFPRLLDLCPALSGDPGPLRRRLRPGGGRERRDPHGNAVRHRLSRPWVVARGVLAQRPVVGRRGIDPARAALAAARS
jgi:hypothetical protein